MLFPYKCRWPYLLLCSIIGIGSFVALFAYFKIEISAIVQYYGSSKVGSSLSDLNKGFLITAIVLSLVLLLSIPFARSQTKCPLNFLAIIYTLFISFHIIATVFVIQESITLKIIQKLWNRFDDKSIDQIERFYSCDGFGTNSSNDCQFRFKAYFQKFSYTLTAFPTAAIILITGIIVILGTTCSRRMEYRINITSPLIQDNKDYEDLSKPKKNIKNDVQKDHVYTDSTIIYSVTDIQEQNKNKTNPYDQAPGYDIY